MPQSDHIVTNQPGSDRTGRDKRITPTTSALPCERRRSVGPVGEGRPSRRDRARIWSGGWFCSRRPRPQMRPVKLIGGNLDAPQKLGSTSLCMTLRRRRAAVMPQDYDAAVRTVHHLRRTPRPGTEQSRSAMRRGHRRAKLADRTRRLQNAKRNRPDAARDDAPRSIARGVRRRGLAAKRPGVADGHPDWADLHLALARMRTVMSLGGRDVGLNQRIQRSRPDAGAELIRRQRRGRGRFPLAQSFQLAVAGMQPIDPLPEGIKS